MNRQPKAAWVRYVLPFAVVLACILLQRFLALMIPAEYDFPYAIFYLMGVLAVAWFGGYVPGAIACVLVLVGLPMATTKSVRITAAEASRLAVMTGVCLGVSHVAHGLRRSRENLRLTNLELDRRVQVRTQELTSAVEALEAEAAQHKDTAKKLRIQLERLNLLDQITRAIGERQDLPSVFQVAVRSIEDDLPVDFACACLYDAASQTVTVTSTGVRGETTAVKIQMSPGERISIDQNGLSRCIGGQLVYEPDIEGSPFSFPQRLSSGGLRSLVIAPLLMESKVFGVFVAARRGANAFSSRDCEFLRQLSEHVALAAHQAQIHSSLQQAYDDLRQTQQTVFQQERLRALGQMASGIAHDINNALSPVALYTDILLEREDGLSQQARDYLETTQRAVEDVANTLARMREFYRPQPDVLNFTAVSLNETVRQVLDLTRVRWSDMAHQRGTFIELKTDLTHSIPAVSGIESEIREALTNLVFNAIDAMPEGGTLTLRTYTGAPGTHATDVRLEVSDTGIGMDEETRRQCLEPFFTTKGERGTGLGLAMVYGSMQRHSADIHIESEPGRGTTFRLIFPVQEAVASTETADAVQPRPQPLRLLLIDDDPLLIKSLCDALESDGHTVVIAHGGKEGIQTFRDSHQRGEAFGVVITDLGMPHVDGRRVAAAIKETSPQTPVILLTGWGQRMLADGDIPPHVDRVLNKPPKLRELRAALVDSRSEATETS